MILTSYFSGISSSIDGHHHSLSLSLYVCVLYEPTSFGEMVLASCNSLHIKCLLSPTLFLCPLWVTATWARYQAHTAVARETNIGILYGHSRLCPRPYDSWCCGFLALRHQWVMEGVGAWTFCVSCALGIRFFWDVFPPVLIRTVENLSVWTSAISFATTQLLDIGLFVAGLTKSLSENTYCTLDSRSV